MIRTTSRLRSINPVQLGLVLGLIYAVLSFIAAVLFVLFGHMLMSAMNPFATSAMGGITAWYLVIFPVVYFVGGFIAGVIVGALYNLVAGWTGGIELTFEAPPV